MAKILAATLRLWLSTSISDEIGFVVLMKTGVNACSVRDVERHRLFRCVFRRNGEGATPRII
jgi:hypothetical protein